MFRNVKTTTATFDKTHSKQKACGHIKTNTAKGFKLFINSNTIVQAENKFCESA